MGRGEICKLTWGDWAWVAWAVKNIDSPKISIIRAFNFSLVI
jgi:hypothetical protein